MAASSFSPASRRPVPGQIDSDLSQDLFLYDRLSGEIRLVTHAASSTLRAAMVLRERRPQPQRPLVAYTSFSTDLAAG